MDNDLTCSPGNGMYILFPNRLQIRYEHYKAREYVNDLTLVQHRQALAVCLLLPSPKSFLPQQCASTCIHIAP
jgi:hypothetical protein